MKLRQAIRGLFARGSTKHHQPEREPEKGEAVKALETERLIQTGVAANKFPPR